MQSHDCWSGGKHVKNEVLHNFARLCVHINGGSLEQVFHFKYPDSTIQPNDQARNEFELCAEFARRAFLSFCKPLGTHSEISLRMKLNIY